VGKKEEIIRVLEDLKKKMQEADPDKLNETNKKALDAILETLSNHIEKLKKN